MNFFTILTIVVGYFVYLTYKPYLMDIAIAALLAIAVGKVHFFLSKFIKNKILITAILTIALTLLIFGPLMYFLIEVGKFVSKVSFDEVKLIIEKAQTLLDYLPSFISKEAHSFFNESKLQSLYQNIMPLLGTLTAKSAIFIKDSALIIIFFAVAIMYGDSILLYLKRVIPIEDEKLETLFFGTSEVMSIVFISTILTALLEGILFGFVVSLYGLDFFFFSIMYAFASLIPLIGGVIMWGPVSLYLYANGNIQGAIVVAIYSIVVISIIADTFVKPWIIHKVKQWIKNDVEINSLLIFFSIVAGLSSFGIWGIIIGPAVTSLFVSILKFYEKVKV
jgi:predicted PurR-regulated permease PerM